MMKIAGKNPNKELIFIADIGANHDGDLNRAKDLIARAKEAGAHVAKFQHFNADTIVSRQQFDQDNKNYTSHQSSWSKSVYDVYKSAAVNLEWTEEIKECCNNNEIEFLDVPNNELDSINITNLTELNELRASNNNLTTIDLSNNTLTQNINSYPYGDNFVNISYTQIVELSDNSVYFETIPKATIDFGDRTCDEWATKTTADSNEEYVFSLDDWKK